MLLFALPAHAQFSTSSKNSQDTTFDADIERTKFMCTAHVRAIMIPEAALDLFYDAHANHWSAGKSNLAYGGSFSWRQRDELELAIHLDYADVGMSPTFWNQSKKPLDEARYTLFDLHVFSAVFASYWSWDPAPWISPYIGGGLGLGVVLGDVTQYRAVENSECRNGLGNDPNMFTPDSCVQSDGSADPTQIDPNSSKVIDIVPVVPILHAALGVRFNITAHGVLKLELGLNDYVYAGASLGVQWW